MTDKIPLKYECLDRFQNIVRDCADDNIIKLLIEMFDLIVYQMNEIKMQRMEIISLKHTKAWKHYENSRIDRTKLGDTIPE